MGSGTPTPAPWTAAICLLATVGIWSSCSFAGPQPGGEATTVRLSESALAGVILTDQHGIELSLGEELERPGPVYLNFIFTSCGAVCPVMTAIFAHLDRRLQDRAPGARLLSVSIDPQEDTPARLRDYAAEHQASPRWRFLTGATAASEQVQRAFDAWRADRMNHPVATFFRPAPDTDWVRVDGFVSAEELLARL